MILSGISAPKWQDFQESLAKILKVTIGVIDTGGRLTRVYNGAPPLSCLSDSPALYADYNSFFEGISRTEKPGCGIRIVFDPLGLPVAVIPLEEGPFILIGGFLDRRDSQVRINLKARLAEYGISGENEYWKGMSDLSLDQLRDKLAYVETLYSQLARSFRENNGLTRETTLLAAVKEINHLMVSLLSMESFDLSQVLDLVVNSLIILSDSGGAWVFTSSYPDRPACAYRGDFADTLARFGREWEKGVSEQGDLLEDAFSWISGLSEKSPGLKLYWDSFKKGDSSILLGVVNPDDRFAIPALPVFTKQVAIALEMSILFDVARHRMGSIINSMRHGVVVATRDGATLLKNSAASAILSRVGIAAPINRPITGQGLGRAMEEAVHNAAYGRVYHREESVLESNGIRMVLGWDASPLVRQDGVIVGSVLMFEDITDRKEAAEALRLSEERFSKAFHASPDMMAIISSAGRFIDANGAFLRTTGFSREEITGPGEWPEIWAHQNEKDVINRLLEEGGCFHSREVKLLTRSGETRVAVASADTVHIGGERCVLLVMRDVTDHRRFESEMARLDRLNLVGELAAGIGHEVRNPMTTVRGFLQMLGAKSECAQFAEYFNLMIEELDRANSIITDFLSVAKNRPVEMGKGSLNLIVESLTPLITADAMNSANFLKVDLGEVPEFEMCEKEIRQMVLNLVRNGLEAMPGGGTLSVSTIREGDSVVLSVTDQGAGIPQKALDKLGTPFFTTKEKGTGLGLAVCYGIAARHNASFKVDTGPGGSTFSVRFKIQEG